MPTLAKWPRRRWRGGAAVAAAVCAWPRAAAAAPAKNATERQHPSLAAG